VDVPVLELVTDEAHDDVHLGAVDRVLPDSDVTRSPVAYALSYSVEQVDVQEDLSYIILARSDLPPLAHTEILGDFSADALEPPLNYVIHAAVDVSAM